MNLLLADDDEDTVALLELLLTRQGWRVICAASVREAQEALGREAVDVVLSDYNLGDGLGTALFGDARPASVRLALLVSGACEQISGALLTSAHFDRCLSKPVEPRTLLQLLQPLLAAPPSPEPT